MFFSATTPVAGRELYSTDGTGIGTQLLADLRAGGANGVGTAPALIALNGLLLFPAVGTTIGSELHVSNGLPAGTALVKDIRPQSTNQPSQPQSMTVAGGRVYFTASDEEGGREVWTSDGTQAGTARTADIQAGSSGSNAYMLTAFGSDLLFAANNGSGTGQTGIEYYRASGATSSIVADINPGTGSGPPGVGTIGVSGGIAYFSATDGASGAELWRYDGVSAPVRVADFVPGSGGLSPSNITGIGGFVYFSGTTSGAGGFGNEPYRTDGTTITLLEDFNPGSTNSSSPSSFFGFGGKVFMRATAPSLGSELVAFDPTTTDVFLVRDIRTGSTGAFASQPPQFTEFNGALYFLARDNGDNVQLFTTNGEPDPLGTATVKSAAIGSTLGTLVKSGDFLFFNAGNAVGTNVELWAFDGVSNGGQAFPIEINPSAGSFPTDLTDVNGVLYFAAAGPTGGNELYRVTFDGMGVPSGAALVADLNPSGSAQPRGLRFTGNKLFFSADNGSAGEELWVIDFGGGTGACCVGTNCSVTTQGACTGAFQGLSSSCGPSGNPTTCCPANYNGTSGVEVQNIFEFLNAWFAGLPAADFNGLNGVDVQDIFEFLNAWFAGC